MRHLTAASLALAALFLTPSPAFAWGQKGHELVNRAAAEAVPEEMPAFFRDAVERLADLGYEPDRWRNRNRPALRAVGAPDHFLDYEYVEGILDPKAPPEDRYAFIKLLLDNDVLAKHDTKLENVGYAPYRVAELCERLETLFARWVAVQSEAAPDDAARARNAEILRGIEGAIVWTAGVLGHYVADLANPHHVTMHYNGWRGENPNGYPTDRGTHSRFETKFVDRVVSIEKVRPLIGEVRQHDRYLVAAFEHGLSSFRLLHDLYGLDKDGAFTEGQEASDAGLRGARFAHSRLAAGAGMLRDLWVSAWRRASAGARPGGGGRDVARDVQGRLRAARLDGVRVRAGRDGTVTLSGGVSSDAARERAIAIARETDGVRRVEADGLRVRVAY